MFVQLEDTDLTQIPLFILNTLLHFTNVSICFGVAVYHFIKSSQSAESFFLFS